MAISNLCSPITGRGSRLFILLIYLNLICPNKSNLPSHFHGSSSQLKHIEWSIDILKEKHSAFVQESRLRKKLFEEQSINPLILPVKELNETKIIEFKVYLNQIIHLEEKSQIMKTNVWLQLEWNDHQFNWNKKDYGGLGLLIVSPKYLWKPDIVLFNNADGKYEFDWQPNLLLSDNGHVVWIPPAIYISSCRIEVEYFPFDQQECDLKFGSLTFNSKQVNFKWLGKCDFLDLSDYWISGTWDVIDVPGRLEKAQRNGNETDQIVYTITLRRKTLFYTVNLILPCVMISMLSICVFYLPADAGEKMTLCISILFALVVFLLLISKILPPTSTSIPLISRYLLFTFIMNIFAILFTMVIINWNYRTTRTHAMPNWIRLVFMEVLPKILRLNRPIHVERDLWLKKSLKLTSSSFNSFKNVPTISRRNSDAMTKVNTNDLSTGLRGNPFALSDNNELTFANTIELEQTSARFKSASTSISSILSNHTSLLMKGNSIASSCEMKESTKGNPNYEMLTGSSSSSSTLPPSYSDGETQGNEDEDASLTSFDREFEYSKFILKREISDAAKSVNYISSKMHEADEFEDTLSDWKYVASVVDRLMLIIFAIITVLATVSIFTKAPFIFDKFNQKKVIAQYSTKNG